MRDHIDLFVHATLGVFAVGFLTTFLPRHLKTTPAPVAILVSTGLCANSMPLLIFTDQAHLFALAALLMNTLCLTWAAALGPTWLRASTPLLFVPAGLVVQSLGIGVSFLTIEGIAVPEPIVTLGEAWQRQAGLLLMTMGVAAVVLPQFTKGRCCSDTNALGPDVKKAALITSTICLSYAGSLAGSIGDQCGAAIRCLAVAYMLAKAIPLLHPDLSWPKYMHGIWLACWSILIGLALRALWPGHVVAWNHFIYVTGFVQITLFIAARVLTAHGGSADTLQQDRIIPVGIGILMLLAVLARIGVDWSPRTPILHLGLAGACALAAIGLWAVRYGPFVFRKRVLTAA